MQLQQSHTRLNSDKGHIELVIGKSGKELANQLSGAQIMSRASSRSYLLLLITTKG
jgi:hypothetical protein